MTHPSVLVIGAGVIGLCAAYSLQKRGFSVTVVDRDELNGDGCSFGNAGMVVPSHFVPLAAPGMVGYGLRMLLNPESPFALRLRPDQELARWAWLFSRSANAAHVKRSAPVLRDLGLASRLLYEQMASELGEGFGLTQRGLLMFCKRQETLHEEAEVARHARELGLAAEVLTQEEAHRLDPALQLEVAGAVYFPQDCHLDPNRLMAALARRVEADEGTLIGNTRVTGWRTGPGGVEALKSSAGEMKADHYVVAGGSWSAELVRPLGLRLPLQAGRGYSITLQQPRELPELCSILTEARIAVTPMGGALRFAGTMELGATGNVPDPRRVRGMTRSIPSYFPGFNEGDFDGQPVWSGLRPCSPDGLPYLGTLPRFGNVVLATGHAMMGVSLAPVTGELVADLVEGKRPAIDLTLLRPGRFG